MALIASAESGRLFVDSFVSSDLKTAAVNVWDRLDQVKDGLLTLVDIEQLAHKVRIDRKTPNAAQYWEADFWTNMLTYFDLDGDKKINQQEFFWGLSLQLVNIELKRKFRLDTQESVLGLIHEMQKFLNEALMSILKNIAYASCGKEHCSDFTVLESIFRSAIVDNNQFGPVYAIERTFADHNPDLTVNIILDMDDGGALRNATDEAFQSLDGDDNGFLNPQDFGSCQGEWTQMAGYVGKDALSQDDFHRGSSLLCLHCCP